MFRVKHKQTKVVYQVLDTYLDEVFANTYFLVWDNGDWRWRPASNFIPPNWEESNG